MTRMAGSAAGLALVIALLVATRASADMPPAPDNDPCADGRTTITVITHRRELWLCRDGASRGPFSVALGRGGLDKRRAGDGRTPVGTYEVGTPRSSDEYGMFIPIRYPTPEQTADGYTGGAIGIHGPPRGQFQYARWTTAIDWTMGCIATGDDLELALIVDFVRDWQPVVVIR